MKRNVMVSFFLGRFELDSPAFPKEAEELQDGLSFKQLDDVS